jgi:hypothetical protein
MTARQELIEARVAAVVPVELLVGAQQVSISPQPPFFFGQERDMQR